MLNQAQRPTTRRALIEALRRLLPADAVREQEEEHVDDKGLVPDHPLYSPVHCLCSIESDIANCCGYRPNDPVPPLPVHISSLSSKPFEGGPLTDYPGVPDGLAMIASVSSQKAPRMKPEALSKRWGISLDAARRKSGDLK